MDLWIHQDWLLVKIKEWHRTIEGLKFLARKYAFFYKEMNIVTQMLKIRIYNSFYQCSSYVYSHYYEEMKTKYIWLKDTISLISLIAAS